MMGLVGVVVFSACANVRLDRSTVDSIPSWTAPQLFEVALFHVEQGDFFRAEQYLVAARSLGYDNAATTYWLVRACVSASRYHSALRHAEEHLRHNPSNWRLRLVVASLHEALGELEHARRELMIVVRSDPERPLPHYRIGMLDVAVPEKREAARAHLEEYLALAPHGFYAEEVRAALESWQADHDVSDSEMEPEP
jgi:Flp pilus assembly protein TadD